VRAPAQAPGSQIGLAACWSCRGKRLLAQEALPLELVEVAERGLGVRASGRLPPGPYIRLLFGNCLLVRGARSALMLYVGFECEPAVGGPVAVANAERTFGTARVTSVRFCRPLRSSILVPSWRRFNSIPPAPLRCKA
jgi:hypothetical protein